MARPEIVHLALPSDRPPWTRTGLQVRAGEQISLLGSGFVRWSPRSGHGAGAKYHLWGRVPGGRAFGCTQDTTTVVADADGELELCVYRGAWADHYGGLATGEAPYRRGAGGLRVTAIRWPRSLPAIEGLQTVDDVDPLLARAERRRLAQPIPRPPGWTHLLEFGETDIFRAARSDGRPAIEVVCDDDVGILTTPVRRAVTPRTRLEWSWRLDRLPSTVREDRIGAHDYLSIALEFGDGRDLSWFWSAELPPGAGFRCPAPRWSDRETHVPVRSGSEGLGCWRAESRNVSDDVTRFAGGRADRIVAVWLIAVSHFSRSVGRAVFRDIRLVDDDGTVQVL